MLSLSLPHRPVRLAAAILLAALGLLLTLGVAPSPADVGGRADGPDAQASGCWGGGPTVTDYTGHRYATRWCHNYRGFDTMLPNPNGAHHRQGHLYAGDNWFVCQKRKFFGVEGWWENPSVGDAHNNVWLYTQGDVSYGGENSTNAWGYFPATHVSGGGNFDPIPGLPWCVDVFR